MKLEIGCGDRPTPGYLHNDLSWTYDKNDPTHRPYALGRTPARDISLGDNSLTEVIAVGVMEHMTYADFRGTLVNVFRMLKPGHSFYFDVPDIETWCSYMGNPLAPFPEWHILNTIYGWQRFEGDEHKSGWTLPMVEKECENAGFLIEEITKNPHSFLRHGLDRNRMHRWGTDVHIYVIATKPF